MGVRTEDLKRFQQERPFRPFRIADAVHERRATISLLHVMQIEPLPDAAVG
ncbi:MAG: hypothetical protein KDE27_07515 [Planctomycetes bacterium]|nr:hypothetical protein [Planctomycetota bacterium]